MVKSANVVVLYPPTPGLRRGRLSHVNGVPFDLIQLWSLMAQDMMVWSMMPALVMHTHMTQTFKTWRHAVTLMMPSGSRPVGPADFGSGKSHNLRLAWSYYPDGLPRQ